MQRERRDVLELVLRYGWNATAFQTLEAGYSYFFRGDACVAYVDTGSAWVAAGAPIAPAHAIGEVAAQFVRAARVAGRRCCFFAIEERLQRAAQGSLRSFCIGEQPFWDPADWPRTLQRRGSLREQLRRARARGVRVRRASAGELASGPVRRGIERVLERWLATRAMAPMGFLVRVEPFTFPTLRPCFVAEIEGRVIGFAGVVPVPARAGWFVEDLVRHPEAPNGTSELLIDAVMTWAREVGSGWLTLGLSPLSGDVPAPLRLMRRGAALLYDFEGLNSYRAKFEPRARVPLYLAHPADQRASVSTIDALIAFSGDGLLRFGLRSLRRWLPPAMGARAASSARPAVRELLQRW